MDWHYARHNRQEGPVTLAELQRRYESGQVAPTDLVWTEGMAEWIAAQQVTDLNPPLSRPPKIPSGPPPVGSQAPQASLPPLGGSPPTPHRPIPNYLLPDILVIIFCCTPLGIPAVVYAAKVDGLLSKGDLGGAEEASKKAKLWMWISFGLWFPIIGLLILASIFNNV